MVAGKIDRRKPGHKAHDYASPFSSPRDGHVTNSTQSIADDRRVVKRHNLLTNGVESLTKMKIMARTETGTTLSH